MLAHGRPPKNRDRLLLASRMVSRANDVSRGASLSMHYLYILCCSDDTFYVGSTRNLEDRVIAHNDGRGASYTFKRRPVRLVYSEAFLAESEAIKREHQLKHWSAAKKESLVTGDIQRLKRLSKPRS